MLTAAPPAPHPRLTPGAPPPGAAGRLRVTRTEGPDTRAFRRCKYAHAHTPPVTRTEGPAAHLARLPMRRPASRPAGGSQPRVTATAAAGRCCFGPGFSWAARVLRPWDRGAARRLGSSVGALACRPLWPAIGTAHGCSMQPRTARRASPTWTACGASTRSIDSRSHGEGTESSPPYTWSGQRRSGVAVARFRRCGLAYLPLGAMGSVAVSPTTCDQLGT